MDFDKLPKKANKWRRSIIVVLLTFIFTFILTIVISDLVNFYTGTYITTPFLKLITPAILEIEVIPFPLAHDDKQWIRINLHNKGVKDFSGLNVEYTDFCVTNDSNKALTHFSRLEGGKSDFFEIETTKNTACSPSAELPRMKLYKDDKGKVYCDAINKSISVCLYCPLNIQIFSDYKLIKNVNFSMPFFEGGIDTRAQIENCLPIDMAEDPTKLNFWLTTPIMTIMDISTMCLTGEISKEWCDEYGYSFIYIK